ncbi:hypothetical protein MTO96_007266 [Rhipicephalus appendiculatus]
MSRPKVYVTRPDIPAEPMAKLRQHCEVTNWDKEEPVNYDVLVENIIATMSVGFEHIDLEECKKRNITVTNTPNVSSDSVAEMTIAMALAAGRRLVDCANAVKA